ncbi:MAG: hypothetical protein J7639_18250 [Paenibacillaceae bacterium]|uniref:hypothetical protein n=1 Tax=Paenibacillus cymbidii TaxID=1639034 RepID=UPI001080657D|nr:hypothetical protein [Paenibacillus cymbidii]MBO9607909.1 hypothetical protein [Paenibacillaceae bacterium]
MTVKYAVNCFDSEVYVYQEDPSTFHVNIQSFSRPLGQGNKLETFGTEWQAIEAAKRFCQMYAAAKEKGYYLKERHFIKPERETIPIRPMLASGVTVDDFVVLISN